MIGIGTLINGIGILIGGFIGLFFANHIKDNYKSILMLSTGLGAMFIGISGTLKEMLVIQGSKIEVQGAMMMIICLCIGSLIGEVIDIEWYIKNFGNWLKDKTKNSKDNDFVNGFITVSIITCVGAMTLLGAIEDGTTGNYTILGTKAVLDGITVLIMSSSMGKGCIFSVIPVVTIEGILTICASLIKPILTAMVISNISLVGSILIFVIGINIAFNKKIKVANMLPAVVAAGFYVFVPF